MNYWKIGSAALLFICAQGASAAEFTDRLIVKLRTASGNAQMRTVMSANQESALSYAAGIQLARVRVVSGGGQVVQLARSMTLAEAQAVADKLQSDPSVEYAEPDVVRRPMLTPSDAYYGYQWYLWDTYGIQAPAAWDVTTGSSGVVVAVLDSGVRPHADLTGRMLPGYDFVSDAFVANDNDATRDSDPSDPGNWVTSNDISSHAECTGATPMNSYWHGTAMAGVIGAVADTSGIVGINWASQILPVRVMGKCGGSIADIADGMRWAAGLSVPGVPANPYPAKVLNLSLGGAGACSQTEQSAIDDVINAGKAVVVAAGNDNGDVANTSPANCNGVIVVTATNQAGARWVSSPYGSNTGNAVTISAPGQGIASLWNSGTTVPVADNYVSITGTSASTAIVSGVISLMFSVNSQLSLAQVKSILRSTAAAFPDATCTTSTCGGGIVNAAAAVGLAKTTTAKPAASPSSSGGGGGGGGGCVAGAKYPFDPMLACMAVVALAWLRWRRDRQQ